MGIEEKVAPWTGAVFGVFLALRTLLTPAPPFGADPALLEVFFQENRTVWLFTVVLTGGVVIAGTWFFGVLRERLVAVGEDRMGTVAFGGWILAGGLLLVRHGMIAMPAISSDFDTPALRLFITLSGLLLPLLWVGVTIASLAVAVGAFRSGAFPVWFVGVTVVFMLLTIVGCWSIMMGGGYFSPTGGFRTILIWAYAAWGVLGSVALVVGQRPRTATPEAPAQDVPAP